MAYYFAHSDECRCAQQKTLEEITDLRLKKQIEKTREQAVRRLLQCTFFERTSGVLIWSLVAVLRIANKLSQLKEWALREGHYALCGAYAMGSPSLSMEQRTFLGIRA
jgi:hypothetical protein